jgi:hypothetical protein
MDVIGLEISEMIRVEVKKSIDVGIEYRFTVLHREQENFYEKRRYYVLLDPYWEVTEYFDSWPMNFYPGKWKFEELLKKFNCRHKFNHVGIEAQYELERMIKDGESDLNEFSYLEGENRVELETRILDDAYVFLKKE